jgi:hypothetical protein
VEFFANGETDRFSTKLRPASLSSIQRSDGSTYDDSLQQNWHTKEKSGGTWSINVSER